MIPFLLIILIMISAFTVTYNIVTEEEHNPERDPMYIIKVVALNQYKLMYGDFGTIETESIFEYVLLIMATMLVPLLMLNLLIAIISEAFA